MTYQSLLPVVSGAVAAFAVLAPWDLPNSKYWGCSGPCWGGMALGGTAAPKGEMEGEQGWGHGKCEWCRYPSVTCWPHAPRRSRLYALLVLWMPHAERDVFAKKGKIDRKHMAGAELEGLVPCCSPGLAEVLGLQV